MLNDPKEGDIFVQRAIIIDKKSPPVGRVSLILHVSNEHGQISEPKIEGKNVTTIFEDNFDEQFDLDPHEPGVFIRYVKIAEYDNHEGIIHFHRLDVKGKVLPVRCKEKSKKFLATYFLSENGFQKKQADQPIDLTEEI